MFEIGTLIEHFPYVGVFVLLILGGIGLPFPEDATLILSGFLIAHGLMKPLPAFLVIYPALIMTDFSLYWVGKKYGRMKGCKSFHSFLLKTLFIANIADH